jgi:S1-C subfamily serine protease
VVDVFPDSPALDAGLAPGDLIVAIDGTDVASAEDVSEVLTRFDPGDSVAVSLLQPSGDRRTVEVELAQRPAGF